MLQYTNSLSAYTAVSPNTHTYLNDHVSNQSQ